VSALEDRLRDAYRDEAGTVTPGSIRGLEERIARRARPARRRGSSAGRWGRVLAPLAAAAAVVAIIVLAAVALRPSPAQPASGGTSTGGPKFIVTAAEGTSTLSVRDGATGALAGVVHLPDPQLAVGGGTAPNSVATADGRHYLVAVSALSVNPCRSWLYQFTLNDHGQPGAVTPFAALPTVGTDLYDLAISTNGQMIGYATSTCPNAVAQQPGYLGVTNVRTGKTTRWSVTGSSALVQNLSLTADGSQLCYSFPDGTAAVRVIPTSAAAGQAADRGRTVLATAQVDRLGGSGLYFAAISADGKTVYFSASPEDDSGRQAVPVQALDIATGQVRVVQTIPRQAGLIVTDPGVRHLLLRTLGPGTASTSPELATARLALLDLATGKISYLPSGWFTFTAVDVLSW
jgi:hypothetical protein